MSYIGNIPTTQAFPFDQFSGTGAQTAFTLTYAAAGSSSVIVAVSGVMQNPNTYSIVGTTLTFTGAPPSGTNNIEVLYLGLPAVGVTTPGNTAYFASSVFTATAGQTVFTPAGTYTAGFVKVIRNGSQLAPADFVATNGTTVTLNNACLLGDTVVIEVFTLTSLTNALALTGGTVTGTTNFTSAVQLASSSGTTGQVLKSNGSSVQTWGGSPNSASAVASTSGTSIDFTGIPSWVKRITVMFNGVSSNSTSSYQVQLGASGAPEISGYAGNIAETASAAAGSTAYAGAGFVVTRTTTAAGLSSGILTLVNVSSNTWVGASTLSMAASTITYYGSGNKSLAGVLDRVRITTVNGTDTFDAGSINILYE